MENENDARVDGGGRRRAKHGSHRAGGSAGFGAGRHRAAGLDLPGLPFQPKRLHVAVAVASCLVVAVGIALTANLLGGDEPAAGAGTEAEAPLLFADGEAVGDDFAQRHTGLVDQVHAELESRYGVGAEQIYDPADNPGGLRVVLTLDQRLQAAAEAAAPAGVAAVEPGSGAVLCYSGAEEDTGADQAGATAPHPPSEVFDLVTAAAALENGASIESWWPDEDAHVTLTDAVRERRAAAVEAVAEEYGTEAILGLAAGLGVTAMTDADGRIHDFEAQPPDPDAFAGPDLGAYAVSVLDMATVYATIANDGVRAQTHFIARVVDGSGNIVRPDEGIRTAQAVTTPTARDLQYLGLGDGIDDREFFGLEGTWTEDPAQSWFVGAIPQLSVAAWIGRDGEDATGEPVWRQVVGTAIDVMGYDALAWPGAAGAGSALTDAIENEDGSIDPDSAYCLAHPDAEPCGGGDPTTEPVEDEEESDQEEPPDEEPSQEEPPEPEPTEEPTEDEPSEEPSEEPTEDCHWLDPSC